MSSGLCPTSSAATSLDGSLRKVCELLGAEEAGREMKGVPCTTNSG